MFFKATNYQFWGLLVFLIVLRFLHMTSEVDDPHAWRQYDTKQYIEGYFYDDAAFLEPTVCWMGDHKTVVLEFPLPEYLIAQLFKVFGPKLIVARLFFLLFFVLTLLYLYKALRLIFQGWVPIFTVFIVGSVPLSLFYSRAIHIDFFVLALSMGLLYFTMKSIRNQNFTSLLIAFFCGSLGLLIKAPYVFYSALPILYFAYSERKTKWFLYRSPIFLLSGVILFLWVQYSNGMNATIPDWNFIPNFNKFTDMSYWYFGNLDQRLHWQNWFVIGTRIYNEILGVTGTFLLFVGLFFTPKKSSYKWALALLLGTIIYALVFFNLNVIHNYYQLPFVICLSIFIALGLQWILDHLPSEYNSKVALGVILPALVLAESFSFAETQYYTVHNETQKVAEALREFTDRDDRIITCYGGLTPQCPIVLQPAGRYGWSIPIQDFTPEIAVELYQKWGATTFAIYYGGYFPEGPLRDFYEYMKVKKSVQITEEGMVLYMCELDMKKLGE